jgi:hypothetical protein
MARSYRRHYEESLPELLAHPRETEINWQLIRSESRIGRGDP